MNSNKRAPKSLPTCGTIRGAQGLQVQLKNGLAGTKRYADLSAGDAPIAYQSSHPFHSPRVGASRCQTKKKKAGAALDPTHHQRGCHPARRSNPAAPRQGIKTASAQPENRERELDIELLTGARQIHCAIEFAPRTSMLLPLKANPRFAKVDWGYGRIPVRDCANAGWIHYVLNCII